MSATTTETRPDQRLGRKYCFDDADMDLFFVAALGWGPAGGLDVGQAFYIASQITDGDGDSWMKAFSSSGDARRSGRDVEAARLESRSG